MDMSEEYIFEKTARVWNGFADGAADFLQEIREPIERHKPTIVAFANSITGAWLGYRFAGKTPSEFWPHLARHVPANFARIQGSQVIVDYAKERLQRDHGIVIEDIDRHRAIWSLNSAIGAIQQLDHLIDNPRARQNFAKQSGAMYFLSAVPDVGVDLMASTLREIEQKLRGSHW
jgi:hypothetical protein